MKPNLPTMPASAAFTTWYDEVWSPARSLAETVKAASSPDADPLIKFSADLAAALQTAFEAGRQSAAGITS
jgi:hypothetical protein